MDSCGPIKFDEAVEGEPKRSVSDLPEGSLSEKLKALFEIDFEWQLKDNPEFATQAGFHQYDTELQELAPRTFESRKEHNAEVKVALEELVAAADAVGTGGTEGLSATERLYMELLLDAAEGETRGIDVGCHLSPLNSIGVGGVHENFLELLEWMRFEDDDDFKIYLNRLMSFPAQVDGFCNLLAYGSGMCGAPASKSMLRKVPARLKSLIESDLDELRAPLKGKEVDPDVAEHIEQAIHNCFRGGLDKLHNFITELYLDRARAEPGIAAVRDGPKVYAECLRFHTTTQKSAQEIHDMGLQEVARIEGRFQKEVLDVLGFKGAFPEFADSLKADKAHFYDTEDALMEGYKALVDKITQALPRYFFKLPVMKLEVVKKTSGPVAYYFAGTPDGTRPGRFYVNVSRLSERPRYEMAALALHEGVPGHPLQGALALENAELPDFLRYIEDRRYEFGAARRPLYAAYLEGWALYCERLGEEMGMYTTPYELFGRLSMEMMRAVRLVVDTGIHAFGWSIERAAEYMQLKTGMAASECEEECHRYAAWPGQACAYKVGQLAIEDVREKAQAALGDKFSLPAFHDFLLNAGPLPLDVLARRATAWIASQC